MWKVCVADDEKYVQKSIAQRIESSGMEIEVAGTAGNGMEALLLYEKMRPDIFFVDINMPVINGLDFIERIRRQYPEAHTRFIIISGYLLIYNILYISISRDTQFYGQLKTIGTTKMTNQADRAFSKYSERR